MTGSSDIPPLAQRGTGRLYFLDNLRIALTILVIAHHVGQAYGPTGGSWPIQEAARARILGPFFTVNRSFFMSLFFLISGYLMVMSYDRSRPLAFVKGRLLRLGVPLLAFFFLVIPLQQYVCHWRMGDLGTMSFGRYYVDAYLGHGVRPAEWKGNWPEMNFLHLWYVEHLLIVSLCYAALRVVWKRSVPGKPRRTAKLPGVVTILLFALVLAFASATIRIWYPIDKWIGFLGFIQVAFADVPRDLSFFLLGVIAYRRQWFLGMSNRMGRTWLLVGLSLAVLWYAYAMGLRQLLPDQPKRDGHRLSHLGGAAVLRHVHRPALLVPREAQPSEPLDQGRWPTASTGPICSISRYRPPSVRSSGPPCRPSPSSFS